MTGKIIFVDSTNNSNKLGFVMKQDSSDERITVLFGEELSPNIALSKNLKEGLRVKIKGEKIKYIRKGKEDPNSANVMVIDSIEILK